MLEDVWSVVIKADDDRIEFKERNVWYTQILQIADSVRLSVLYNNKLSYAKHFQLIIILKIVYYSC